MKRTYLLVSLPVLLLAFLLLFSPFRLASQSAQIPPAALNQPKAIASATAATPAPQQAPDIAQDLIDYALSLRGTPYIYGGMSESGFDCSGFVSYVFGKYDVKVPHSSGMQAEEGKFVPRAQARPGDVLIFTGTNPKKREPGHVGIVISESGKPIEFVHASSNGGVKVSRVKGTRYNLRFLEVRRVL